MTDADRAWLIQPLPEAAAATDDDLAAAIRWLGPYGEGELSPGDEIRLVRFIRTAGMRRPPRMKRGSEQPEVPKVAVNPKPGERPVGAMATVVCSSCGRRVDATRDGRAVRHPLKKGDPSKGRCSGSRARPVAAASAPSYVECAVCQSEVKVTATGKAYKHSTAGAALVCEGSGKTEAWHRTTLERSQINPLQAWLNLGPLSIAPRKITAHDVKMARAVRRSLLGNPSAPLSNVEIADNFLAYARACRPDLFNGGSTASWGTQPTERTPNPVAANTMTRLDVDWLKRRPVRKPIGRLTREDVAVAARVLKGSKPGTSNHAAAEVFLSFVRAHRPDLIDESLQPVFAQVDLKLTVGTPERPLDKRRTEPTKKIFYREVLVGKRS
ncbi:hypothetical protein WBG06_26430 [Nocardioides sp. CCNWLW239]|uniref:hypothetical protein n=1 Tax=Nocardioides sp. CCNWLW239 TaxID=3128902 RepID=UPI003016F3B2